MKCWPLEENWVDNVIRAAVRVALTIPQWGAFEGFMGIPG